MSNVEDRRDYGAFIPSFLDDFRLDMPSFRLYAHIARRAGSGNCWESIDKMAETCQMNRKTAYKAFKLLQDHKLILVEKRKGQTSLITLTNHCVWIPIPNQVQVDPIPNQVQPCPKSGTTTYTKSGTGDIPNQVQPPIPNQVHKGTPIEVTPNQGTPIEVTPIKGKENIYVPPTEILPEPIQPVKQVLIADMAEEKETPIPPPPLASLLPENVELAIAKPKKAKKQKELKVDPNLFLEVWLQDSPRHWIQHRTIDSRTIRQLINFTNEFENSLEIFQKGLWYAQTDKQWCMKPERHLGMSNLLSENLIFKFYQRYEDQQARSQQLQSNTDRPMTASDINKAEKYLRYKEALTA